MGSGAGQRGRQYDVHRNRQHDEQQGRPGGRRPDHGSGYQHGRRNNHDEGSSIRRNNHDEGTRTRRTRNPFRN